MKKILTMWNQFSKTQKLTSILCAVLALVLVIGVGIGIAAFGKNKDTVGNESTEGSESLFAGEVFMTEETEMTEVTEMEVIQTVTVSMTATSFEKDLKIKILDENKTLIAGQPFVITVTPEGSESGTDYNDHDMDGIIYIKSIAPGKYTVQLQELEGFVPVENPITATVKEQIVYEKVEIKDEIKDESQIDASKEDTTGKTEEVENVVKDTITLIQSTVATSEVAKDQIDFSSFADASISTEKDVARIDKKEVGEDGAETIVASAEVSLPKTATLYTSGKDSSKKVELKLNVVDNSKLIKDIKWLIDGNEISSSSNVLDVVVAQDEMSAVITMKSAGQAKISVVITYEEIQKEDNPSEEDSSEDNSSETNPLEAVSLEEKQPKTVVQLTKEVACTITVGAQTDSTTPLKDVNGNTLYLDKEATKPATIKDYDTAEKFYTNPKYTGWQTLDGKVYYFKEDHTYATGKQTIGGVQYEFDETGYLITKEQSIGIDVSKWQGDIDWKTVAESGIDFAIIRCGYRGISTGALVEDPYFKKNIKGATENGIKVGVYFYSQAITKAEAIEEASMALELVKGYHLQLPIYIDTEGSGGRGDGVSKADRTSFLKAFCETIKNAGYKPGVYSGRYWFTNHVNASELEQYHIWVAQYNDVCTYKGRYDIWQYTSSGTVPGIKGRVDMDIAYRVYY